MTLRMRGAKRQGMKKALERATIEAFLNTQGVPLSAVSEWDRERPDCLARIDGVDVGIEVTYLTEAIPRYSTRVLQWRREASRIVQLAQAEFERDHPQSLIAYLGMSPDWTPGAVKAAVLAKELAETVAKALCRPRPYNLPGEPIQCNRAHPALSTLWVSPSRSSEGFWRATVAGSVLNPSTADVQATVARKEPELRAYRRTADVQWLLIDCSPTGQEVAFDVPEPATVVTGFDRVSCTTFGLWQWVEMNVVPPMVKLAGHR